MSKSWLLCCGAPDNCVPPHLKLAYKQTLEGVCAAFSCPGRLSDWLQAEGFAIVEGAAGQLTSEACHGQAVLQAPDDEIAWEIVEAAPPAEASASDATGDQPLDHYMTLILCDG